MIIIDNIVFYLQRSGGISVVWKELITRLSRNINLELAFIEYDRKPINIFHEKLTLKNIYILRLYCLSVQRFFNLKLSFLKHPYIFHSSYYRYSLNPKAINVTTVHDFTYEYYVKGWKQKLHTWQKNRAIRHSDYIICISENTKRDLLSFLPDVNPNKIKVIYNGVSDEYYPIINKQLCIPLLPFPENSYFIFVGSRVGYKNFQFAMEAVAKSGYNFVIVGTPLTSKEIEQLEKCMQGRYKSMGYISNTDLNILYNCAFALIYPSSYEGFGIPVLEAQKASCPVIAYNSSSIPEIIGNTPLLLENLSIEAVEYCVQILENREMRMSIIENGIRNSKKFTWDKTYEELLQLYSMIMKYK